MGFLYATTVTATFAAYEYRMNSNESVKKLRRFGREGGEEGELMKERVKSYQN